MSEKIETAIETISRVAQESPNPHAFYSGMVFGLGFARCFLPEQDIETAACIMALIDKIDDIHFNQREL